MVAILPAKKVLLAFLYGCLTNFIYQHTRRLVNVQQNQDADFEVKEEECPPCKLQICPTCPPRNIVLRTPAEITVPYKPKGMYEISRWLFFDESHVYDIINEKPKVDLKGLWREESKAMITTGLRYVNENLRQNWNFMKLQGGYMRVDGGRGADFLLDIILKSTAGNVTVVKLFRVHLVHPFTHIQNAKLQSMVKHKSKRITIIIPISQVGGLLDVSNKYLNEVSDFLHEMIGQ